jgi:hypothetical protein
MPYVGNSPTSNFASVTKDAFSGDGSTTAFTLSKAATTNGVAVFVENVRQEPTTAYAVSGTTLTFTAAPVSASGNNIYVLHHNAPASTATHPSAQALTATSGTFTGTVTAGSTLDMNGTELILDADADTSITADTDDEIHFKVAGDDHVKIKGGTNVLHVIEGSSGQGTPHTNSGLVIESDGETGINILTGNTDFGGIVFGDSGDADIGFIQYNHDDNYLRFGVNAAERLRINSVGFCKFLGNSTVSSLTADVHQFATAAADEGLITATTSSASYAYHGIMAGCARSSNTSYSTFSAFHGDGGSDRFADRTFTVDGTGQISSDASTNVTSGADYAEYFEWKDGNSSSEDRIGQSVVLDGNKIRKATSSDNASNILGVISGNPSVVGDSASLRWQGKWELDDFNRRQTEEVEVWEWEDTDGALHSYEKDKVPEGLTVPSDKTVKKINNDKYSTAYDASKKDTYVPRKDRKEWDAVGLMGKLRILKGQPTGDRWIKMRDISDTVEEWLVR